MELKRTPGAFGLTGGFAVLASLSLIVGGGLAGFQLGSQLSRRVEVIFGMAALGAVVGLLLLLVVYYQLVAPREGRFAHELLRCLLIAPPVACPPCLILWAVVDALELEEGTFGFLLVPPPVAVAGAGGLAVLLALLAFRLRRDKATPAWLLWSQALEELGFGGLCLGLTVLVLDRDSVRHALLVGGVGIFAIVRGVVMARAAWRQTRPTAEPPRGATVPLDPPGG